MDQLVLDTPESYVAQIFEASMSAPWKSLEEVLRGISRPDFMPTTEELFAASEERAIFLETIQSLDKARSVEELRETLSRAPLWMDEESAFTVYLSSGDPLPSRVSMNFARACEAIAQEYLNINKIDGRAVLEDVVVGSAGFRIRLHGIADNAIAGVVSGILVIVLGAFLVSPTSTDVSDAALQTEVNRLHHICVELAKRGDIDAVACYSEYAEGGKVAAAEIAPPDPPQAEVSSKWSNSTDEKYVRRIKGVFIKTDDGYIFKENKTQLRYGLIDNTAAKKYTNSQTNKLNFITDISHTVSGTLVKSRLRTTLWVDHVERTNPPRPSSERKKSVPKAN